MHSTLSLFTFGIGCLLFCTPSYSYSASKLTLREYPVPEHGMLQLNVPEAWNITYYESSERNTPVIIFYPQQEPHDFQLTISPLWDTGFYRNITDPDYIENFVSAVGRDALLYSDQQQLELIPLTGKTGRGFYFQLSDQSAPEHEFRYLLEGAIAVGEILLVFSYFSNLDEDSNTGIVLKMVTGAVQILQRDVHFAY